MSIEVFINDVSTYSLQDYNIAFVKFDKKALNLSITNSGIQGELKSINMDTLQTNMIMSKIVY